LYVGIKNCEPQYQNMALDKWILYHTRLGDQVETYMPLANDKYDKIICSSIFSFTDKSELLIDDRWECGGTGFDLYKKLPDEVENIVLRNNYGFTQIGCDRGCSFCVVNKKEGNAHPVGDIYDIWDGKSKSITLYDNNILLLPQHFNMICSQLRTSKVKVDWNQGLDIRLLNNDVAEELASIKHAEYHFAYDNKGMDQLIIDGVNKLVSKGIKQSIFYVLIGFNTTIQEDLHRLNLLRKLKQRAFVMFYQKCGDTQEARKYTKNEIIIQKSIKRWANKKSWFAGCTFEQFVNREENRSRDLGSYKIVI